MNFTWNITCSSKTFATELNSAYHSYQS